MSETILRTSNLSYRYQDGDHERVIFDDVSISFEQGKFYSITGESGSGKTTFLYCIGGLDEKYTGDIYFHEEEIRKQGLDSYRRNCVSMVYQNFNLIPYLSALQNMYLAADITNNRKSISRKEALEILKNLGIDRKKAIRRVSSLSGGEQQRVAIARAIVMNTSLFICDEPTGNLDTESGLQVIELFQQLVKQGKTIIMVTHNNELAEMCDVHYHINQETKKIEEIQTI